MNPNSDGKSESTFKRAQARHRRRGDNPNRTDDFPELVDFGLGQDDRIFPLSLPEESNTIPTLYRGPIYGLKGFPGLLFAPQALTKSLQSELAHDAVSKYCESPHTTNIDLCPPKNTEERNGDDKMWELWKRENNVKKSAKKPKIDGSAKQKYRSFKKLSWATQGYHYGWTERSYNKQSKSDMPSLVGGVSTIFARTSLLLEPTSESLSFEPTACIVNYYNPKSMMGGHKDDLEIAMDKPVVSLSMGLSAVFLLGGKTKEELVLPILIRTGDVLCMGGDCRLNFHSMARLLPCTVKVPDIEKTLCPTMHQQISFETLSYQASTLADEDRTSIEEFLFDHRINFSVRQVYPDEG